MLKPCLSLIVLVSSTTCSPVNYLGVPGYSHEVISPSLYPVRTALDVLQPSLGYGYGQGYGYGYGHGHGYGYGYPLGLTGFGFGSAFPTSVFTGFPTIPAIQAAAPVVEDAAVAKDVVDVAAEEIEEGDSPSLITIQVHIDALPTPKPFLFRDPLGPPIPAGIVQATQPKFVQVLFKNPKLSPHHSFISNSKSSAVLQEIKELSAGITIV